MTSKSRFHKSRIPSGFWEMPIFDRALGFLQKKLNREKERFINSNYLSVGMNKDKAVSDRDRMEMIWVDRGVKPVGEIKKNASEYKQALDARRFYSENYNNSLLYSKNPEFVKEIKHAIDTDNYEKTGKLFGYPECCTKYFTKLKNKGLEPGSENLKEAKNRLKNNEFVPAYFANYVFCPACNSTRNSPSGRLEEMLGEVLKSKDYHLYERFKGESNGRIEYIPTKDGEGMLLWNYTKG